MHARHPVLKSELFGDDLTKILPVIAPGGSDSANLDNAVELLALAGRSLPHVMSMLIPEAWDADATMASDKRAYYEYHASLEGLGTRTRGGRLYRRPRDRRTLDRNGLRPARYLVTKDGLLSWPAGGRSAPDQASGCCFQGPASAGKMLLAGHRGGPESSPTTRSSGTWPPRRPYAEWLSEYQINLDALPEPPRVYETDQETVLSRQRCARLQDRTKT